MQVICNWIFLNMQTRVGLLAEGSSKASVVKVKEKHSIVSKRGSRERGRNFFWVQDGSQLEDTEQKVHGWKEKA